MAEQTRVILRSNIYLQWPIPPKEIALWRLSSTFGLYDSLKNKSHFLFQNWISLIINIQWTNFERKFIVTFISEENPWVRVLYMYKPQTSGDAICGHAALHKPRLVKNTSRGYVIREDVNSLNCYIYTVSSRYLCKRQLV